MQKSIYINIITKDIAKSTAFYTAIGCTQNMQFSNDVASAMNYSDTIMFMLLTPEFALNFNDNKALADSKKTVSAYFAIGLDSKAEVDEFCTKAKAAGGRVYDNQFNLNNAGEFMYTYEVEDPDGYILEPFYMDLSQFSI